MHTLTYTNNWWLETNQQPPTVTELNALNQLYLFGLAIALVFILG